MFKNNIFLIDNKVSDQQNSNTLFNESTLTQLQVNIYYFKPLCAMNFTIISSIDYLCCKVTGEYEFELTKKMFSDLVDEAVRQSRDFTLIDISEMTGTVSIIERYDLSSFLADYRQTNAPGKYLKIALTGHEPQIDSARFGQIVAQNRGVNLKVFTDIDKALGWLLQNK